MIDLNHRTGSISKIEFFIDGQGGDDGFDHLGQGDVLAQHIDDDFRRERSQNVGLDAVAKTVT